MGDATLPVSARTARWSTPIRLALFLWLAGRPAMAAESIDFERSIRPLFARHCVACHGPKSQKGGLRLDARSFALRGGDGGPVVVAGRGAESELLRRVASDDADQRMPPEGPPLPAADVALLKKWIDDGAAWPETEADRLAARDPRRDHWAWQPIVRPPTPVASPTAGDLPAANPIDAFVRARLEASGLRPAPQADRRTLVRRLSFDLLGLPPTIDEVEAFAADSDPTAYERLLERLLASPRYGERWARHWLDVAHYADTHGFERDQRRDNAWPYRDYVIRALNEDRPYDEFLREQIAGDALRPDDPTAVVATGFLAAGPWDFVGQVETRSDVLRRAARADDLDDMVAQVMTAACGVTIHCARCHDHKLDPISQREYYSLWAVFSGVKRGERPIRSGDSQLHDQRQKQLADEIRRVQDELSRLNGGRFDLAEIVGRKGDGIDLLTGKPQPGKRGFLAGAKTNQFQKSTVRFVDGVTIPDASPAGTTISSTGVVLRGVPKTSGQAWDAVRSGPVNSQHATTLGGEDFAREPHSLLMLHANGAITFDLAELRRAGAPAEMRFVTRVGYFGQTPKAGASFLVAVDGQIRAERQAFGRDDGLIDVEVALPAESRFLTLVATDNGNGISHDQVGFADPRLIAARPVARSAEDEARLQHATRRLAELEREAKALVPPEKVYAIQTERLPPVVRVLRRGDPESPLDEAAPGAIGCLGLPAELGTSQTPESERRRALADWIVRPENPLAARVIVNRLWHHHFGVGIVDTPSDFGLGGGRPSHPELLDWLADELRRSGWSLKTIHRLICGSRTYRRSSRHDEQAAAVDAGNRLLWRASPRRLEAEAVRDAVLAVSGSLDAALYGPGFHDFAYEQAYAPIYRYGQSDSPAHWRRSVYRFVVRTTPQPFLTTLDCPNPANLTPARSVTTTPLQALALLNNEFMLSQSARFAARLERERPADLAAQARRAFELAVSRPPTADEQSLAERLARTHGLPVLCRMLFNANEFHYVD